MAGTVALPALAQTPGRAYRVGAIFGVGGEAMKPYLAALKERLAAHGFAEGRNLRLDARGAIGTFHEDRELALELLAAKPDALLTSLTGVTRAAQAATRSTPIIFVWVADPVAEGFVKSLARPGGNATGVTNRYGELLAKRVELARELLPAAKRIAIGPAVEGDLFFQSLSAPARAAAARLGMEIVVIPTPWSIEASVKTGAEAILPLFVHALQPVSGVDVIRIAAEKGIPVIYSDAAAVEAGGLISYGTNLVDDVRRGADLLTRMLKGAKPGELPVDQAARFELAVNLKTARALGLTISQSILLRADRVIE
jgi:putative ABC transport system substrate-binding protein